MRTVVLAGCFQILAALPALADERQDLLKALHDAELKLEMSKRRVPPAFDPVREGRFIANVAERLGFAVDIRPLAGAENAGEAYAYGPWRRLLVLEPGARVFDGSVKSIGTSGVRFVKDGALLFDLQ